MWKAMSTSSSQWKVRPHVGAGLATSPQAVGAGAVPVGHVGLLNQREETPKQTEEERERRGRGSSLGCGALSSEPPPLFSWEIYFSICCLLILFTRGALVRSQVGGQGPSAAGEQRQGRSGASARKLQEALQHVSWELSPSVETRGSYGFGFFPQFSVGLVWLTLCFPISGMHQWCFRPARGSRELQGTRGRVQALGPPAWPEDRESKQHRPNTPPTPAIVLRAVAHALWVFLSEPLSGSTRVRFIVFST